MGCGTFVQIRSAFSTVIMAGRRSIGRRPRGDGDLHNTPSDPSQWDVSYSATVPVLKAVGRTLCTGFWFGLVGVEFNGPLDTI